MAFKFFANKKIGIEAVRGSSYLSDIGIDDIEITPGVCNNGRTKGMMLFIITFYVHLSNLVFL